MKRLVNRFRDKDTKNISLIVGLIILLAFGGVKLGQIASARMLHSDALSTSGTWAASLTDSVEEFPAIFAGTAPTDRALHVLTDATQVGDVYC